MLTSTRPTTTETRPTRRLWKSPRSHAWWLWLVGSGIFYAALFYMYLKDIKLYGFDGPPGLGPLAKYGLLALGVALLAASYTLRRRFMRFLPGQLRNWLWMHNWLGITALLIVMLHANFDYILHNYCMTYSCFSSRYFGPFALYGLILLVGSGIAGRLINIRQTRVIARDASTNGAGIVQVVDERLTHLTYAIERLYAGKSDPFQHYCQAELTQTRHSNGPDGQVPSLPQYEWSDFEQVQSLLNDFRRLQLSRQRQLRAQRVMRWWHTVHIILACVGALMVGFHLGTLLISKLGFLRRL